MKRLAFIPLILGLGVVALTMMLQGSNGAAFFSPSAINCIFLIGFVLLLGLYNPREMARAFRAIGEKRVATRQELLQAKAYFMTMRNLLLALGPFAFILGSIHILEGLGLGGMEAIGEGAATSLLGLWYAFGGLIFIAIPGIGAARKKLALLEDA